MNCYIGIILVVDGSLSLFLPRDKHWLWQAGRIMRIALGIVLIVDGFAG